MWVTDPYLEQLTSKLFNQYKTDSNRIKALSILKFPGTYRIQRFQYPVVARKSTLSSMHFCHESFMQFRTLSLNIIGFITYFPIPTLRTSNLKTSEE